MLLLLGTWLLITSICLPAGAAILRWLGAGAFDRPADRAILSLWLGVLALGSALLAASLLVPLSPATGTGIGVLASAAALASAATRAELRGLAGSLTSGVAVGTVAVAAGVALFTSQPIGWFDTGLYHVQAIVWLADFGIVEGLGLIHDRLGLTSSWFALAAPFSAGDLREHSAAVMGGFALLLVTLHALAALSRALAGEARIADWVLISGSALILLGLGVVLRMHVSPTPDLPVNAIVLLVGWVILTLVRAPRPIPAPGRFSPGPAAIPLALALATMAIKPQAAPLVAVAAVFFFRAGSARFRHTAWLAGLGLLLVGPWLAAQLIATGCPAYPFPICVDVPWSLGAESARETAATAESFARWRGPEGDGSWLSAWVSDDFSPSLAILAGACALGILAGLRVAGLAAAGSSLRRGASWAVLVAAAGAVLVAVRADEASMLALAILSFAPLGARERGSGWLLAIGLSGVALTLYAAPDPRFAFGYMAVLFARLLVLRGRPLWPRLGAGLELPRRPALSPAVLLLIAALAAALGPLLRPTAGRAESVEDLGPVVPASLEAPVVDLERRNSILYRIPLGLCWASELPCVPPEELDGAVGLRDPERGLEAGFERVR